LGIHGSRRLIADRTRSDSAFARGGDSVPASGGVTGAIGASAGGVRVDRDAAGARFRLVVGATGSVTGSDVLVRRRRFGGDSGALAISAAGCGGSGDFGGFRLGDGFFGAGMGGTAD
jgi:hypothetical protein